MTQNAFGQNAALCRTHATYVHLIATQEVTGGIILGYLLLAEVPSFNSSGSSHNPDWHRHGLDLIYSTVSPTSEIMLWYSQPEA